MNALMTGYFPMELQLVRQPIIDIRKQVFGFELLFRNGTECLFHRIDDAVQTAESLKKNEHLSGLARLSEGRKCFIRVNRQQMIDGVYRSLPTETTVLEIMENEELDRAMVHACRQAGRSGYNVALNDCVVDPDHQPLLDHMDLLKVNFPLLTDDQHHQIIQSGRQHKFSTVAENIQGPESFRHAASLGYSFFQGPFYCHADLANSHQLATNQLQHLRLLQAVHKCEFELKKIEELIRQNVSLSVKLLQHLNSPVFSLRAKIGSIRQAVSILGHRPLRKWASLITVEELSSGKPRILMNTSLIRAKFCEAAGEKPLPTEAASECFLLGMLSLLDTILDLPMSTVLPELGLSDTLHDALMGVDSPLRKMLDLIRALETGDWSWISALTYQLGIPEDTVYTEYRNAVLWANEVFSGTD